MTTPRYLPKSFARHLERKQVRAARAMRKRVKGASQSIADTIAARGDDMSDEGREFLEGLADVLDEAAGVI